MALCDELEAARQRRERRRDRLVAASLYALNNGDENGNGSAPSFEDSIHFYFNHLPRLTTRPEQINKLRSTILNLGVRGRLVSQNPHDEPASEILKRILEGLGRAKGKSKLSIFDEAGTMLPNHDTQESI